MVAMKRCIAAGILLASCGDFAAVAPDADTTVREEVARVTAVPNLDVDVLFLIDDSPSMLPLQDTLKAGFPALIAELGRSEYGLPNLHIGVVTSDLGARGADDAMAGPPIGGGAGSCSGDGKQGNLTISGSTLVTGTFISDIAATDGSRMTNYTGTLAEAFSSIAAVGTAGCGFEQHVQAAKRALDNNPANAGFLRQEASLAIVIVGDEDDCSMSHSTLMSTDTTTLGPLQSFRCTRFGISCDVGGTTTDEMNIVGMKVGCHSNESSAYLTPIESYAPFFQGLKSDPARVSVGVLAGPVQPFNVVLKTPPGGTTAIPYLDASCMFTTTAAGDAMPVPAVRLAQFAASFNPHSTFTAACSNDLSMGLTDIGRNVRSLIGDSCLRRDIAMPANCVVTDTSSSGMKSLPQCGGSVTNNCYTLAADPGSCSTSQHLRLQVMRSAEPPPDTVTVVQCVI